MQEIKCSNLNCDNSIVSDVFLSHFGETSCEDESYVEHFQRFLDDSHENEKDSGVETNDDKSFLCEEESIDGKINIVEHQHDTPKDILDNPDEVNDDHVDNKEATKTEEGNENELEMKRSLYKKAVEAYLR